MSVLTRLLRFKHAPGLVLLVVLGGIATLATLELKTVRARVLMQELEQARPGDRWGLAYELASLGEPGLRALETVAFSAEVARPEPEYPTVRQAALSVLCQSEPRPIPIDRLAWYVVEAQGLVSGYWVRAALLESRKHQPPSRDDPVVAASFSIALSAADPEAVEAVDYLSCSRWGENAPADLARACLRRLVREARSVEARRRACQDLVYDGHNSENRSVFQAALADPDEVVRIQAAYWLARCFHDPAGLAVLVAALRSGAPDWKHHLASYDVLRVLASLRDERTVESIVGVARDRDLGPYARHALKSILGERAPAPDASLSAWLDAHRTELPPQLDPAEVAPGLLHVKPASADALH